jgi:hypothetical protein
MCNYHNRSTRNVTTTLNELLEKEADEPIYACFMKEMKAVGDIVKVTTNLRSM